MKKILVILLLCFILYSRNTYVDLNQYKRSEIEVEIRGEVQTPGVYRFEDTISISSLIKEAGGLKESADLSSINQTKEVIHGSIIIIPKIQEKKCISINGGTLEELNSLRGIGDVMASRIMEYRSQKGFQQIEDLMNVKGIGPKLFEKVKDDVCL